MFAHHESQTAEHVDFADVGFAGEGGTDAVYQDGISHAGKRAWSCCSLAR